MSDCGLELRLIGPLNVLRAGVPAALPRSRKVLALLALLVLEQAPLSRSRLCDLLWDAPNDPRGELRWSLSKLRALVDEPERRRVVSADNALISLDLTDAFVDVIEIERAVALGFAQLPDSRLVELSSLFRGDLIEGLELDASSELTAWISGQRQRFRALRVELLQALALRPTASETEGLSRIRSFVQVAPFDSKAHELLLSALLSAGRVRDAEEHLAVAIRAFEQEGLDWSPLRAAWQTLRAQKQEGAAKPSVIEPNLVVSATLSDLRQLTIPESPVSRRRASVAVMPFSEAALSAPVSEIAHGVTDDIITRLAKLRALFVIARGTTYALGERGIDAHEAGRILDVNYVVTGRVRRQEKRISIIVELAETARAIIVWTDELVCDAEQTFGVLDAIIDRIVAVIAEEIESAECQRAMLKPPNSLDAWEAYHRGLWHMYRFTGSDNRLAQGFFQTALQLDPTFARAHAGLSFTHFQNVFLELTQDRERQMDLAVATAAESLKCDDRDPAAHWAMGRALWLRGGKAGATSELERSIDLSPNFALGHYTLGFVEAQSGDPHLAIEATNTSRLLSPFDPLQFGMLGSRALAHIRLGELEEAAEFATKAIARPNAHAHIAAIAALSLSLTNRRDEARKLVAGIREQIPSYTVEHFLRAFRFDKDTEGLLRYVAQSFGFSST